jgi:hypothetical protein
MTKPSTPTKILVFSYLAILIGFAFYLSHTQPTQAEVTSEHTK